MSAPDSRSPPPRMAFVVCACCGVEAWQPDCYRVCSACAWHEDSAKAQPTPHEAGGYDE